MLEQYRKDFPAEEKDLLPDSESSMGKRKLLFILSGATFALLFFLFLMGLFRNEEENLVQMEVKPEVSKETLLQFEEKLQTVISRLEKLEANQLPNQELATIQASIKPTKSEKTTFEKQSVETASQSAVVLSTPEDAVAMTSQALRSLIEKSVAKARDASVVNADGIAMTKATTTKVTKAKTKKSKEKLTKETLAKQDPTSNVYVVQKGDTLSKISVRYYGTPNRWRAIYEANRERINNINSLKVGTTIVIPQHPKQ